MERFSDHLKARRGPNECDAQFAARLGISRSHWRHIQAGRREVSTAVASRAIALWPELGPLYIAEITASPRGNGAQLHPAPVRLDPGRE